MGRYFGCVTRCPTTQSQPTPRFVGGVLLLVLLGVQLGLSDVRATGQAERGQTTAELSGAKRLGERVVWVFRTLIEHAQIEASESSVPTVHAHGAVFASRADDRGPRGGVELGVWLLDLPPPTMAS